MAEWNPKNLACVTLWTTLRAMQQLNTNFKESGDLSMSDLTYFNNLSSGSFRSQEIQAVANQIDNIFRNGRGATFEEGITHEQAIFSMIGVLENGEMMVKDLAEVADHAYEFWHEMAG